ncbi:hypothetical protein BDW75DRAFT_202735 [Aspergillus navahoensis]
MCAMQQASTLNMYYSRSTMVTSECVSPMKNNDPGADMTIAVRGDLLGDPTAYIAHKLGHAWEMYQEH